MTATDLIFFDSSIFLLLIMHPRLFQDLSTKNFDVDIMYKDSSSSLAYSQSTASRESTKSKFFYDSQKMMGLSNKTISFAFALTNCTGIPSKSYRNLDRRRGLPFAFHAHRVAALSGYPSKKFAATSFFLTLGIYISFGELPCPLDVSTKRIQAAACKFDYMTTSSHSSRPFTS
jgi:hypothetical protein